MTWICLELVVLWMVLPILLVGRYPARRLPHQHPRDGGAMPCGSSGSRKCGGMSWFSGLTGLLSSLALGTAWIAASLPVLAGRRSCSTASRHSGAQPTTGPESCSPSSLLFYASVSVTSQEFLYSSFFFWVIDLLPPGFLVGLNALVFAVAHLVYHSWVSVVLALAGRARSWPASTGAMAASGGVGHPPPLRGGGLPRGTRALLLPRRGLTSCFGKSFVCS